MYALKNRVAEWEIKNEILLNQLKKAALSVLSLALFLIWKLGEFFVRMILLFFERPRLVRKVAPGLPPEEVEYRQIERVHEQGPMVR